MVPMYRQSTNITNSIADQHGNGMDEGKVQCADAGRSHDIVGRLQASFLVEGQHFDRPAFPPVHEVECRSDPEGREDEESNVDVVDKQTGA